MRKMVTVMAAAALLLAAAAAHASEPVKVGYINMQRALENSLAGQEATRKLNEIWDKAKKEIEGAKGKMDALKAEIDKSGLLWNEKTRRDKDDELRRLERDYNRLLKDTQEEIKTKESEFSEGISKDLLRITEEIGKKEGFTLILEKKGSAVLYAPASIDLTDRLIKEYDGQKR